MRYFNIVVILILSISLIVNFTLAAKLSDIENRLEGISSYQHDILSRVDRQADHIRDVMADIQRQQSWISEIQMDLASKNTEKGKRLVTFNWQLKELASGSEVMFHYAYSNQEQFKSVPAIKLESGFFKAEIPIEIIMEPIWEIHKRVEGNHDSTKEMEEKVIEHNGNSLKYYVSVSHRDVLKSSEVQTRNLTDWGAEYYGVLSVDVGIQKDYNSIVLSNYNSSWIEKAELFLYKNTIMVGREDLQYQGGHYTLSEFDMNGANRLVLRVFYKNEEMFEKEIYKE